MRRLLAVVIFAALVALLVTRAEAFAPSVSLETPIDFVGRATPITIVARDRGSGLARVEVRLVPEGGEPVVVASQDYPRRSWLGSEVHEATLAPVLDAAAAHVHEGRAQLEIWATDHSWLARFRRGPRLARPVTDDFLSRKVPELLAANDLDQSGDLVEGYLRINRELRAKTEVRVRQMCRDSAPAPLWQDAFLRLPNSAPLSGFADRRTYVHD